jgi:hypothetical protein
VSPTLKADARRRDPKMRGYPDASAVPDRRSWPPGRPIRETSATDPLDRRRRPAPRGCPGRLWKWRGYGNHKPISTAAWKSRGRLRDSHISTSR